MFKTDSVAVILDIPLVRLKSNHQIIIMFDLTYLLLVSHEHIFFCKLIK